jgi:hypothetical protein
MNPKTLARALPLLVALIRPASATAAPSCPPAPDRVSVWLRGGVTFDPATRLYTYDYEVVSDRSSEQDVNNIGVDVVGPVSSIRWPAGWFGAQSRIRPRVIWFAMAVANPNEITGDARPPPSTVQIPPGGSAGGFSFQSPRPPGLATFHAKGFVPVPVLVGETEADATRLAEEFAEACPAFGIKRIDQGVTGLTFGPVEAVAVPVDVHPGDGTNPVNPRSQGVIPVAVLGTSALDVGTLDSSSFRLGLGQASPVRRCHSEDVNADGLADLMCHFPTQGTELQCGDTLLLLQGRTSGGALISGMDAVVTPGCR